MTTGAAAATANAWLNVLRGTTYTGITCYVKLHIGDPGVGASNASAVTTRNALTPNAASGGSATLSSVGSFSMTTTETITHISIWDASTSGNLVATGALSVSKAVVNTDTLSFTTLTLSITPIAA